EARAFGIHSAQSCRVALRLCPEAVFLRPRFDLYREISREIQAIYKKRTHLVEPLSLDEAFIEVTALARGSGATQIALDLKAEIFQQTGLTASAGVSWNKFLAKIASAHRKPDGLTVIPPQAVADFLDAMPIGKFFGVGEVTEAKLRELGITTGKDLKQLPLERLQDLFGKRGTILYQFARGQDDREVEPERERKSVGKETTLEHDLSDQAEMLAVLEHLSEQVAQRLTELGVAGKTITLKVRWNDFQIVSRSLTTAQPIQNAQTMMRFLRPLLEQLFKESEPKPVRLLGVSLARLVSEEEMQKSRQTLTLWDVAEEREH